MSARMAERLRGRKVERRNGTAKRTTTSVCIYVCLCVVVVVVVVVAEVR